LIAVRTGAGTLALFSLVEVAYHSLHARVIIPLAMPRTFSEITKDLEIAQQKLSATSDPEQRRVLLRQMRQLLEQADNLIQKLERQIPPVSKRN